MTDDVAATIAELSPDERRYLLRLRRKGGYSHRYRGVGGCHVTGPLRTKGLVQPLVAREGFFCLTAEGDRLVADLADLTATLRAASGR